MNGVEGKEARHIKPVRDALLRRVLAQQADPAGCGVVADEGQAAGGHHLLEIEVKAAVHEDEVLLRHRKVVHHLRRLRSGAPMSVTERGRAALPCNLQAPAADGNVTHTVTTKVQAVSRGAHALPCKHSMPSFPHTPGLWVVRTWLVGRVQAS